MHLTPLLEESAMVRNFCATAIIGVAIFSASAFAQVATTQVIAPGETVTTTQSAGTTTIETPTTITKITTTPGHSVMTKSKSGETVEMDSDNSVYIVYKDGARTHAPDGIMTLADGTTVTVKDGKRIP